MPHYDTAFFDYVNSGSLRSARGLLPVLTGPLSIDSVLDVGCGQGAWLAVWRELGIEDLTGVDGDYVDRERLLVDPDRFRAADLTEPLDLGRQFGLVQSLEVAEHLPETAAAGFVSSLTAHGPVVLFSAAPPGQGGDHHINERPYDYWRGHFAAAGYTPFDFVRPAVAGNGTIEPWYRYNPFLYVAEHYIESLPAAIKATRIPEGVPLQDISPAWYRMRKKAVSALPTPLATGIAKVKERVLAKKRGRQGTV